MTEDVDVAQCFSRSDILGIFIGQRGGRGDTGKKIYLPDFTKNDKGHQELHKPCVKFIYSSGLSILEATSTSLPDKFFTVTTR
jgi:hypothetical protein